MEPISFTYKIWFELLIQISQWLTIFKGNFFLLLLICFSLNCFNLSMSDYSMTIIMIARRVSFVNCCLYLSNKLFVCLLLRSFKHLLCNSNAALLLLLLLLLRLLDTRHRSMLIFDVNYLPVVSNSNPLFE